MASPIPLNFSASALVKVQGIVDRVAFGEKLSDFSELYRSHAVLISTLVTATCDFATPITEYHCIRAAT